MKIPSHLALRTSHLENGSVLVIVLWIAFGLVTIALYFANAMSLELRASDNRVSAMTADQAIEGAVRYVGYLLANQIEYGTNGNIIDPTTFQCQAVPVGDAHFWIIGRDNNQTTPNQLAFGLVDEASKLNLNSPLTTAEKLAYLPNMTAEVAANIVDWRDTNGLTSANGDGPAAYSRQNPSYLCKNAPYETVDELRLIFGMNMDLLFGQDLNRNGVQDPNETDANRNGVTGPGVLEYVTVYSREPNTYSNGVARVNVSNRTKQQVASLLQRNFRFTRDRANQIANNISGPANTFITFRSPLDFYLRTKMTSDEFATLANAITVNDTTNYIEGRINVTTASAAALASLLGGDANVAQQLVNYRKANPSKLGSIAWVADALSNFSSVLQTLATTDSITTQSYQFTADIAALGPYGRGYRRVKFIFDTADGTPKIVYRQDLTHLGWALGKDVRQTWLLAKASQ